MSVFHLAAHPWGHAGERGVGLLARLRQAASRHPDPEPQPVVEAAPPGLAAAQSELQELVDEVDRRRAVAQAAIRESAGTQGTEIARRVEDKRKDWREERERLRKRLLEQVVELHASLGTGVSAERLPRVAELARGDAPAGGLEDASSVEVVTDRAVRGLLWRRTGENAWDRVSRLLDSHGLVWPVPSDLTAMRDGDDLRAVSEDYVLKLRERFLASEADRVAGLVVADVVAWRYWYPAPGSYLWTQTAYRSLAASLWAPAYHQVLETWRCRTPELEERLIAAVTDEVAMLRRELRGAGVPIPDPSRVTRVATQVIPELVWTAATRGLERVPPQAA